MKKIVLLFSLAGALLLTACGPREIPAKGDFTVRVFDDTPVRFAPDIYPEAYNAPGADSIYHLVNGRIILKKITLPEYERNVSVKLKVTIASNGDRWDKSGSCFVLPTQYSPYIRSTACKSAVRSRGFNRYALAPYSIAF